MQSSAGGNAAGRFASSWVLGNFKGIFIKYNVEFICLENINIQNNNINITMLLMK